MNELQQAKEQGAVEAKLDMILQKLDNMERDHKGLDAVVDALVSDMSTIKGGIKVLWGVISVVAVLCSGLFILFFTR